MNLEHYIAIIFCEVCLVFYKHISSITTELANLEELLVQTMPIPEISDQTIHDWTNAIREALNREEIELARLALRQFESKSLKTKSGNA